MYKVALKKKAEKNGKKNARKRADDAENFGGRLKRVWNDIGKMELVLAMGSVLGRDRKRIDHRAARGKVAMALVADKFGVVRE